MQDISPKAVERCRENGRKTNPARGRRNEWQPTQAETEAMLKNVRELFAGKPQTFKDGDIVKYIAPDGMLGPFRVGIAEDGSVRLWYQQPGFRYAKDDWGDHVHAIVEKGETFPGTEIAVERSLFTTMGPDTDVNASYLLKMD